jgi:hypothetical protein
MVGITRERMTSLSQRRLEVTDRVSDSVWVFRFRIWRRKSVTKAKNQRPDSQAREQLQAKGSRYDSEPTRYLNRSRELPTEACTYLESRDPPRPYLRY